MKDRIFEWLRPSIDGLMTDRILAFYNNMIAKGQIKEAPAIGPSALAAGPNVTASGNVGLDVPREQV